MTRKKKPTPLVRASAAEYLTFVAASGTGGVEAIYADENVWLSQKMMAQLYDVEIPTINYHLKKVFEDSELEKGAVIRNFRITAADGKTYDTQHYNLSAIIAVGYKVNSERAVQFRKWATGVVEEFTIKGFAMDDERLKRGGSILSDKYFEEQLQRVREIRLSERKFYQKITDIYATSVDYDLTAQSTKRFFATVQNKLHWAIHGQTAAEVIVDRADATREHMGLHTWTDAPHGKIQKFDVVVAKNYLTESELAQLSRLVNAYLDVAEDMALRKIPMTMQDWEMRLNRFLAATDREVLQDAGKVTAEIAKAPRASSRSTASCRTASSRATSTAWWPRPNASARALSRSGGRSRDAHVQPSTGPHARQELVAATPEQPLSHSSRKYDPAAQMLPPGHRLPCRQSPTEILSDSIPESGQYLPKADLG